MSVRKIITIPNEILTKKTEKVTKINDEVKQLIQDLLDTVRVAKDPEAAGIAANQIGSPLKICVVRNFINDPADPNKTISDDIVLINPKIVSMSKEAELDWDGCLSVPNVWGKVYRSTKVKVNALDAEGNEIKLKATGYFARIVQHEIDHLEGILFTDKVVGKLYSEEELDSIMKNS